MFRQMAMEMTEFNNQGPLWLSWFNLNPSMDIKNNAWVTVNNDFGVTSEAICQLKIIGKSRHEWPLNRYSQ